MLGFLGGVGSVISGLDGAGGPGGAGETNSLDLTTTAESQADAVSGGTFSSGNIANGKSDTMIIVGIVALGLLVAFWRKK